MRVLSFALAFLCGVALSAISVAPVWADGQWQAAGRLDAARSGLAAVVLDGTLYAAGGAGLTEPRNEFESYDAELDRWFPETPLPTGLERFGMAVIDDRIYAAGGYARGELGGVSPSPAMWSWSPSSRVWQSEAPMPAPRADLALVAVDGRLYAMGGLYDDESVFVFDPEAREWSSFEAPEGVNRAGSSIIALGQEIIIAGGVRDGQTSDRVDIYDVQAEVWRRGPDLPQPRSGAAIAPDADGRVHLFGGRGGARDVTLDLHSHWHPAETGWSEDAALPSPRTNAAAAAIDGVIYVVGGGSGGGFFAPFTALDSTDIFRSGAD